MNFEWPFHNLNYISTNEGKALNVTLEMLIAISDLICLGIGHAWIAISWGYSPVEPTPVNFISVDDDFYRKYWMKQTPLATAVIANNKPVVRILLEQEGTELTNAVAPAIESHDMEMITLLLAAGSDVERGTIGYHIYGNTNPTREEILVLLAKAGLDVDRITQHSLELYCARIYTVTD